MPEPSVAPLIARRGKSIAPILTGSDLPQRKRFPKFTRDVNGPRSYLGQRKELKKAERELRAERRDLVRQVHEWLLLSARSQRAMCRDAARRRA